MNAPPMNPTPYAAADSTVQNCDRMPSDCSRRVSARRNSHVTTWNTTQIVAKVTIGPSWLENGLGCRTRVAGRDDSTHAECVMPTTNQTDMPANNATAANAPPTILIACITYFTFAYVSSNCRAPATMPLDSRGQSSTSKRFSTPPLPTSVGTLVQVPRMPYSPVSWV